MGTSTFATLAPHLLDTVGGAANVKTLSHCATRLRFVLNDDSKADIEAAKALPGVITVMRAGGQTQVVIGNDVADLYAEVNARLGGPGETAGGESGKRDNPFDAFIKLISALINPLIWVLAGAGLLKAFTTVATTYLGLDTESTTYAIINASGDSVFYFLPFFLAFTSARRFKANEATAMAIAGALVYPDIVALAHATGVTFLKIPVIMASYTSSLIPIIIAVWVQSYLERGLKKILPSAIRNFTTPLIVLFVMVPLTLMTVGPVTSLISNGLASGINTLIETVPWLAGALLGALWQVFVIFGVHWGLVPLMLNDIAVIGKSAMMAPLVPAVLAQGAATLAIFIRSRDPKQRQVAGPAALSGILAGVTEPAIYGINLPLKRPFAFGCIGGAIGGAIAATSGAAASSFVFPSLIGLPAYVQFGSITWFLIGTAVAVVVAFVLTLLFGVKKNVAEESAPEAANEPHEPAPSPVGEPRATGAQVAIGAPVEGDLVALADVADPVFSSGAMGHGVGVAHPTGPVLAPISGTVVTAMESGHAYGIKSDEGIEVLVHIGIDTVKLAGEGFTRVVESKQRVERGETLAEVDWARLTERGYDPTTLTIIMNTKKMTAVDPAETGHVTPAEAVIMVTR